MRSKTTNVWPMRLSSLRCNYGKSVSLEDRLFVLLALSMALKGDRWGSTGLVGIRRPCGSRLGVLPRDTAGHLVARLQGHPRSRLWRAWPALLGDPHAVQDDEEG